MMMRSRSRIGKGQGVPNLSIKSASAASMRLTEASIGINNGDAFKCMSSRAKRVKGGSPLH